MNIPLASHKLAEEFLVIPYPFPPKERQELEAEYSFLLNSGISSREVSEMILYALEVLLHKRKNAKDQKAFNKQTSALADMLGRLLVLEELILRKKQR